MSQSINRTPGSVLALAGLLFLSACGDPPPGSVHGEWTAEREERGDTLIVRTLSGSVWGDTMVLVPEVVIGELDGDEAYLLGEVRAVEVDDTGRIWVVDAQAAAVRAYSPTGDHLADLGRRGEGPGEFLRPDFIRIQSDGTLLVRDQRNARFSRFSPDGEYLGGWLIAGGFTTSAPFHLISGDEVFNPTLRNPGAGLREWRSALVRYGPEGEVRDTLDVPSRGYTAPRLEASSESPGGGVSTTAMGVPFLPGETWSVTESGEFLFGMSSSYRVDRWPPAGGRVLRIEREAEPVPVAPGEASQGRERITRQLRQVDPSWRWQGPEVPDVKPAFQGVRPGRDGTVWVIRHTAATEVENPDWDPERPDEGFSTMWSTPTVFDVFDADGRYLGPVKAPDRLRIWSGSVLTRDRVWAVWPHELGYDRVVRFRVEPASGS